jgi:1-deoxy-D-xylulose-5-phosphate reductoisomerase
LTASGGAFYRRKGSLSRVSVEEALHHPTWKMGKKITLDCATLMNKGFESIEIMNLFGLNYSQIEILIHHQSIIHSAVEFSDGSVLAQMSLPDMRLPIEYAMTYPKRGMRVIKPLNLAEIGSLTFDKPDFRRFPCLSLAAEAAKKGGGLEAVLNSADEIAVDAFTRGKIKFTDIPRLIEKTMKKFKARNSLPSLAEVVEIDQWARQKAEEMLGGL